MIQEPKQVGKMPPRLSMEEYAKFINRLIHQMDPETLKRQRAVIDKGLPVPFTLK